VLVGETERMARQAGLTEVVLARKDGYVDAMESWGDPLYKQIVDHLPSGTTPGDYITSLNVSARKPV
jgi:arsenite methyltransferase